MQYIHRPQVHVISYRSSTFNKDFMNLNFGQLHQDTYNLSIRDMGFPDQGSGFYSQRLDYSSWLIFNKAQRVHQNFVETLTISLLAILIGGLSFPISVASVSLAEFIGRIFTLSYISSKGASHPLRIIGLILIYGAIITNNVFAFITASRILNGQNVYQ
ncbi:mapeg family protein, putative [Ichthyophthirius multifiliis]|uniref:Mapeg family protein, putative n=1 Tax=Ichthyophthirius multifiliis TaxID=5932 RepID=G0QTH4_ICHMU|nr:mapeg family protein, putative [Ichthyophthirius multifiliis]EGR31484.1 mapeg family protein, putative [Ichthyophthirius multifiliis]|eukprot:XP_004034970.1 mapeg family protein, putative [Ichthyophthirius multifiliis]